MEMLRFICLTLFWINIYLSIVEGDVRYATCEVEPNPNTPDSNVRGIINFRQIDKKAAVEYKVELTGFDATDDIMGHGYHVHTYGTITTGCEAAGGHFNPKGKLHGGHDDARRHLGDLGNLHENGSGGVNFSGSDNLISLSRRRRSIMGRALMVHAGPDDLGQGHDHGSQTTGNAGPRVACCVIVASDGSAWMEVEEEKQP